MIIAYVELETDKEYRYQYKIVSEKSEENFDCEPAMVYYETNIANEIMKSSAYEKEEFVFNQQHYKIALLLTEKRFNVYNKYAIRKVDLTSGKPVEIIVYKSKALCPACKKNNREMNLENVIATVRCLLNLNDTCEIEIQHCKNCDTYFVEEQSLKEYEKKYGLLLFERVTESNFSGYGYDEFCGNFAKDTILSRYGYVAQAEKMNVDSRRAILSFLIDQGHKSEIKNILSSFIYNRSERCYKACSIWESDLRFVNEYDSEHDDYVGLGWLTRL
ncbi:MAG: hypothetical protein IIU80_03485 [Clostridia bacterium]|nr:hypothetical protein [Clostridia bacterium]